MTIESPWHQRYGHLNNHGSLQLKKKRMVEGLPLLKNEYSTCEGCALAKMHMEEFTSNTNKIKKGCFGTYAYRCLWFYVD